MAAVLISRFKGSVGPALRVLDSLGTMAPGEEKAIQRGGQPMAMNNTGDTIDLLDADGQVVDSVTYGVVAEGEFVISN